MTQKKERLESKILKNILRAAKKSKNPYAVAQSYGILVDKMSKCPHWLSKEIKGALNELLHDLERACGESKSPSNISLAFGILVDKGKFGAKEKEEEEKALPIEREEDRLKLYREINNEKGPAKQSK